MVVKSVRFRYNQTSFTKELLETFRTMVNDAIRICLDENIRGRLALRNRIYREFQERYNVVCCYPYSVAEVAWSLARKHRRWNRKPFARRLMMKMDAFNYSLHFSILSLPYKKDERILIPLAYGEYQRSFLMDTSLIRGSVSLSESCVIISFTKQVPLTTPKRRVGVDLNEKSAVLSDGTKLDLSEIARLHTQYRVRRRDFYRAHAHDDRLKKKYSGSSKERERVKQALHAAAKQVVERARDGGQAIVLERLKGIRYTHAKGNREPKNKRRSIAQWPFRVLQTYIVYNAAWAGVQVEFVNAVRTSQTCHRCHYVNTKLMLTEREWQCPSCDATLDRDLNAAINIERRGKIACLGEVRPGAQGTNEAVKGIPTSPVFLRADARK